MNEKSIWAKHHEQTKDYPPSPLLLKALEHVEHKNKAIDIGAGALKDTRYLLQQGFDVTAIDGDKSTAELAKEFDTEKLHVAISYFDQFDFPKNTYDLASSMFSLPFNPPETFDAVFQHIKDSLVKGGIFTGQFFGVNDEWSTNKDRTFHTKAQVEQLLADMEIISLEEVERDGKLSNGNPKHWHIFNIIAKKI